jgi:hypothetical protein
MPLDISLDIETLGAKPGCVILSIGAVAFDPLTLPDSTLQAAHMFYRNLTIFDQLMLGLVIDPETVKWWQGQDEEAHYAIENEKSVPLVTALSDFAEWFVNLERTGRVWAKSPQFDCSILEHAAEVLGVKMPWNFRDLCDVRTIAGAAKLVGRILPSPPPEPKGPVHNALVDARYQSELVQYNLARLSHG